MRLVLRVPWASTYTVTDVWASALCDGALYPGGGPGGSGGRVGGFAGSATPGDKESGAGGCGGNGCAAALELDASRPGG